MSAHPVIVYRGASYMQLTAQLLPQSKKISPSNGNFFDLHE